MLVLSRKHHESIRVGDNIVIHVLKTGRSTVRIGIEAPENMRVLRGELQVEATTSEKNEATLQDDLEQAFVSCESPIRVMKCR